MTFPEFQPIFAVCIAGCGVSEPPAPETIRVYYDLLHDLEPAILRAAIRAALLKHVYRSLPPVGLIRQLATDFKRPNAITGAEAWELAMRAVRRFGIGRGRRVKNGELVEYDNEADALKSLPPTVARAVRTFGYALICNATPDDIGIVRAQFLKVYDGAEQRDAHEALMPPSVAALAQGIGLEQPQGPRLAALPAKG